MYVGRVAVKHSFKLLSFCYIYHVNRLQRDMHKNDNNEINNKYPRTIKTRTVEQKLHTVSEDAFNKIIINDLMTKTYEFLLN